MKTKVILTMIYDIKLFPPVISLCNILSDLNYEVVYIGGCSDRNIEENLSRKKKVKMYKLPLYGGDAFSRFFQQWKYRKNVLRILKKEYTNDTSYLWLLHSETVSLFAGLLGKYNVIAHLFEFKNPMDKLAYRLLTPMHRFDKKLRYATKVVCCEYNRAQITKAIYSLNKLPYVLPNKPYVADSDNSESARLDSNIQELLLKYKDKKIILYQGIFITERKLDDFIQAVNMLPDDYVMFLMGRENDLYFDLKKKYESVKIVFLPFFTPPLHLEITRRAYIGILTYIPDLHTIGQAINVLYCAPNKLYEYAKFGVPMVANDLPALKYAYLQHKAGICVQELDAKNIVEAIKMIDSNYDKYVEASHQLYEDIDMLKLVHTILVG